MSRRKLTQLSDEAKEKLRNIFTKAAKQKHFIDSSAASGAQETRFYLTSNDDIIRQNRAKTRLWKDLYKEADPIPSAEEFVTGIDHYNSRDSNRGLAFNVVRAIHSRKMHYYTIMTKEMTTKPELAFNKQFPFISTASGVQPMSNDTWLRIQRDLNVKSKEEFVKHILTAHDGEARLIGDDGWQEFPASGGAKPCNACFWSYQYAQKKETRKYLYVRSMEDWADADLDDWELDWIMKIEGGETTVLKLEDDPASGGHKRWYIRCGNFVTLAELFRLGMRILSCYDLYVIYKSLRIWIHKKAHSHSNSAEAQLTRNAKNLRHAEEGVWGLRRR